MYVPDRGKIIWKTLEAGGSMRQRTDPSDWRAEKQRGIQHRHSVNVCNEQIMDE